MFAAAPTAAQEFDAGMSAAREIVARAHDARISPIKSFKICAKDRREDVFMKLKVYPDATVDVRECRFSRPDDECTPISGLARSNRYALETIDTKQLQESVKTIGKAGAAVLGVAATNGAAYQAGLLAASISETAQAVILNLAGTAASAGLVKKSYSFSIKPSLAGSSALAVVSKTVSQGSQWDCNDYDGSVAELSRSLREVIKDAPRVSAHDEP